MQLIFFFSELDFELNRAKKNSKKSGTMLTMIPLQPMQTMLTMKSSSLKVKIPMLTTLTMIPLQRPIHMMMSPKNSPVTNVITEHTREQ